MGVCAYLRKGLICLAKSEPCIYEVSKSGGTAGGGRGGNAGSSAMSGDRNPCTLPDRDVGLTGPGKGLESRPEAGSATPAGTGAAGVAGVVQW